MALSSHIRPSPTPSGASNACGRLATIIDMRLCSSHADRQWTPLVLTSTIDIHIWIRGSSRACVWRWVWNRMDDDDLWTTFLCSRRGPRSHWSPLCSLKRGLLTMGSANREPGWDLSLAGYTGRIDHDTITDDRWLVRQSRPTTRLPSAPNTNRLGVLYPCHIIPTTGRIRGGAKTAQQR